MKALRNKIISDNVNTLSLTVAELKQVRHLVYLCKECKVYYFWHDKSFKDVEAILGPQKYKYIGPPQKSS